MNVLRVDLAGVLSSVDRRDDGTVRVNANLTRVGIFAYQKPDGSPWREYRPAAEVFAPASLGSYGGRPLTVGHRLDQVNASTWKDVTVGDVRDDAKPSGQFVQATVQVSEAETIRRVDAKDLVEVSCGYRCDLDVTPGTYNGEPYDAIQRNIRLNHVALLPAGRGRAGQDVRLLLDSTTDALVECPKIVVMADNDFAQAQKDRADALAATATAKSEAEALRGELAANKARLDEMTAKMTAQDAGQGAKVAARVALITTARAYLPELRVDSLDTDDQIKRAVIAKINPSLKCDDKAEPAYVDGMFRSLVASTVQDGGRKAVEKQIACVAADAADAARTDSADDFVAAAHKRSIENGRLAHTRTAKQRRKAEQAAQQRSDELAWKIRDGQINFKVTS